MGHFPSLVCSHMNDVLSSLGTCIDFSEVSLQDIGLTFLRNNCPAYHLAIIHSPHKAHSTEFRRIVINNDIKRSVTFA